MAGKTYDETAHKALKIGHSDESMKFNTDQIEDGKFLTVEEILALKKQKNVTPHLFHSLELYLNHKKP